MWRFQIFSVSKILREINFGELKSSKTAIFCNFKGSEFSLFGTFHPTKSANIHENQNAEPLSVLKWQIMCF